MHPDQPNSSLPGVAASGVTEPPPLPPRAHRTTVTEQDVFDSAKRHGERVLNSFKSVDFWQEVWPLNVANAGKIAREPTFWAVILLATIPLLFITMEQQSHQLFAFSMYFALIWGLIFRNAVIVGSTVGYGLLFGVMLFTGLIGIPVYLFVCAYVLPQWYVGLPLSDSVTARLFGCVLQTGLCEELLKMVPVVALAVVLRRRMQRSDVLMLAVFSGLGFAAFENVMYFQWQATGVLTGLEDQLAVQTTAEGVSGVLHQWSEGSMVLALTRSISLTFGHAVWSAIFAQLLFGGLQSKARLLPLFAYGLLVAAMLHGLYNWFTGIQNVLPTVAIVVSFMLLRVYLINITSDQPRPDP